MRITPLDIRNHAFRRRISGYAAEEVDAFLSMIAGDYEALIRESEARREAVLRLEAQVEELSANASVLQETLTTAQQLSEDLKRTAVKEAEVVVGQAEIQAEKLLDAAHRRAARLAGDLQEMKSLRSRMAASLRRTIESHLGLLDALSEDPPEEPVLGPSAAYLARGESADPPIPRATAETERLAPEGGPAQGGAPPPATD